MCSCLIVFFSFLFQTKSVEEKGDPTLLEMFWARGCDEATAVVMALDMVKIELVDSFF